MRPVHARRRLALRRETLAELTPAELAGVEGAANAQISHPNIVCVIKDYSRDFACTANCLTSECPPS